MNLQPLFEPKSLAIIGVSFTNDHHPANIVYNKAHLRYPVNVFPVNPRGGSLMGENVFSDISEIPQKVEQHISEIRKRSIWR